MRLWQLRCDDLPRVGTLATSMIPQNIPPLFVKTSLPNWKRTQDKPGLLLLREYTTSKSEFDPFLNHSFTEASLLDISIIVSSTFLVLPLPLPYSGRTPIPPFYLRFLRYKCAFRITTSNSTSPLFQITLFMAVFKVLYTDPPK